MCVLAHMLSICKLAACPKTYAAKQHAEAREGKFASGTCSGVKAPRKGILWGLCGILVQGPLGCIREALNMASVSGCFEMAQLVQVCLRSGMLRVECMVAARQLTLLAPVPISLF